MNNLPQSLIDIASRYDKLGRKAKTKLFKCAFNEYNLSVRALSQLCHTYPNKIRRDAISLGIEVPNKSQAQKAALKSGRHSHPTKGQKRSKEVKVKISDSMAEVWEDFDEDELVRRSEMGKEQWENKSPEAQQEFREKAGQKIRIAAKEGSKLERFLLRELLETGYRVEFHKEYFLENERLQIDLYLPILKTAIEVDGPSHFEPIWGNEVLVRNQRADATKNGLLLGMGMCIIRVQQKRNLSNKFMRDISSQLLAKLSNIEDKFPDKDDRYIELGD
jgi:very-short-patch-repair endonuclease